MVFTNAKPRAGDAGLRRNDQLGGLIAPENKRSATNTQVIRADLIGADICTSTGITVRRPTPVLALCRELLAQGLSPDAALAVYREGIIGSAP